MLNARSLSGRAIRATTDAIVGRRFRIIRIVQLDGRSVDELGQSPPISTAWLSNVMTYGRPRPPPMTTPSSPQTTSLSLPRPRHPKRFVRIARRSRQSEFAHRRGGGGRPCPHRICTRHRNYRVLLVDRAATMPSLTIDDVRASLRGWH